MLIEIASAETMPTTLQTVNEFEAWERQHPHESSYEFVRGRIIPKPAVRQNELDLIDFLVRQFMKTPQFNQKHTLYSEIDSYVDGLRKRVPDLTYFTADQRQAIRRGERVNTLFAIRILSDSESHEDVLGKIDDYFDGGAQLVWYVIPKRQRIEVYMSSFDRRVYTANDQISAAPVIPEMSFTVADLFA